MDSAPPHLALQQRILRLRDFPLRHELGPPNPASDAFHAALGFTEVGRASILGGSKTVRYLQRTLEASGAR